jgi:hypothetical protein
MDLLEDTNLRRGHGSEAVHGFVGRHRFEEVSDPCPLLKSVSSNKSMYSLRSVSSPQICVFQQIHVLSSNLCLPTNPCPLLKSVSSNKSTDLRLYMDLLVDTDLRRGHGSEAVHGFVGRHRFEERTWI